jgi:hypothetical protein
LLSHCNQTPAHPRDPPDERRSGAFRRYPEAEQRLLTDHQIDFADVFQGVVLEVDELLRAEVEHRLTVGGASSRPSMGSCRSRTNADDRLPADPLRRIESGEGIVEGRDRADVRP